jgi:hypothetical protein
VTKNTEDLLVAYMRCAAHSGGIETLPAQQFISRHNGHKDFVKEVKKNTNADVEKTFPKIAASRKQSEQTGKFL